MKQPVRIHIDDGEPRRLNKWHSIEEAEEAERLEFEIEMEVLGLEDIFDDPERAWHAFARWQRGKGPRLKRG